jgi:hypothetical protein
VWPIIHALKMNLVIIEFSSAAKSVVKWLMGPGGAGGMGRTDDDGEVLVWPNYNNGHKSRSPKASSICECGCVCMDEKPVICRLELDGHERACDNRTITFRGGRGWLF